MDEFFEDIKFLASFVGCNIFEIIKFKDEHIFYTNGRGCNAMGFYNSSGFTVLKGSIIASTSTPSLKWRDKRQDWIEEYTATNNGRLTMISYETSPSPSTAADFCNGRCCNGWDEWKDKDGRTMDPVYRKQI